MAQKEYGQIRARKSSQETLKRLSELTGYDVIDILEQWTKEVEKVIDSFENPTRISFMSARHVNDEGPTNLVVTYIGKLVVTSFPLEHSVSDEEAEKKARVKAK